MIKYSLTIKQELEILQALIGCNSSNLTEETRQCIQKNIRIMSDVIVQRSCVIEDK